MPLQELADRSEFSWVTDSLRTSVGMRPKNDDLRTLDLLPQTYEAYVKILHPAWENPDLVGLSATWADSGDVDTLPDDRWSRRVRWAELADLYDVPYGPDLSSADFPLSGDGWPVRLLAPEEGSLLEPCLETLVRALSGRGGAPICYYWWWMVTCLGTFDQDALLRGELSALRPFIAATGLPSPTYWWREDRAWCVATDWDLWFSVLGGTQATVERVLAHPDIEGFRLEHDDIVLKYSSRQ